MCEKNLLAKGYFLAVYEEKVVFNFNSRGELWIVTLVAEIFSDQRTQVDVAREEELGACG